jgi:hypothetical protein
MPTYAQSITFRDVQGHTTRLSLYLTADTQAEAGAHVPPLIEALRGLTVAHIESASGAYTSPSTAAGYGSTGSAFMSISDKARLTFVDAVGSIHRYEIPSPSQSIFLKDGATVNRRHPALATLAQQLTNGAFSGRGGGRLVTFVGGTRVRRPMRRKMTMHTLSARYRLSSAAQTQSHPDDS